MLTVADVAERTGVPQRKISRDIYEELIEPEFRRPTDRGDHAILGDRNVTEVNLIRRLEDLGIKRQVVKDVVSTLAQSKLGWWQSGGWLVFIDAENWFVTDNPFEEQNAARIRNSQSFFVVELKTGGRKL